MKLPLPFLFLCLSLLATALTGPLRAAYPEAYVYIDVDFKILVKSDGETTQRPGGGNYNPANPATANADADTMLNAVNQLSINGMMNPNLRGLRYRRFGDVQFVRADVAGVDATLKGRIDGMFRSTYTTPAPNDTVAEDQAYTDFDPSGKLLGWAKADPTKWKWVEDRANFYLTNGFGGGVGYYPDNLMFQGGFWVDPGTHELGHWLTLPHPFRTGGGPPDGSVYWGDQVSPAEHGDGFADTLVDHVNGVQSLDTLAGRTYKDVNGAPKKFAALDNTQKTVIQGKFRDHYALQFFNIASYNDLSAAQKGRIPVFETAAPAPTIADREILAIHLYGVGYDSLATADQNGINNAIANPDSAWWIGTARYGVWYCKIDDDLIARHDFALFRDQLDDWQREQIRLLNANIMAYRAGKGSRFGIFSEQQLDRMADVISGRDTVTTNRGPTRALESGKYFFMGGGVVDGSRQFGCSLNPSSGLFSMTLFSSPKDVVIARPGNYALPSGQPLKITKAMSIRATRYGPAVLGKP